MTAEERAVQIAKDILSGAHPSLVKAMADVVSDAVSKEREACAQVAEAADCDGPECNLCGCKDIAVAAIRARV